MNWDDFRIVSAVCKTGSFTRAGRILQINETTVGRRINRLETEMGLTLFDAVDGMRRPTQACAAIMRNLREMEKSADEIRRALRGHDHLQRQFRLSTIAAIAEHWLAPHLPQLLTALPDLSLSIDTSDQNVDMSRWEADFALRLGRPKQGSFLMRRIGQINFVLVQPARTGADEPLLVTYPEAMIDMPEMVEMFDTIGNRQPRVETSDLNLIRELLASGRAIGVLPEAMAHRLSARADLLTTPITVAREVWLLSQPYLRDDPVARELSAWLPTLFAMREESAPLPPKDDFL
ncbi:LysR family transcriptional regulator [Paracoccus sp. CPCC 101403]|uniref:LysR family transcriptional regulator n=2 Tax=Paracoccus broussonetiae TaxID=3075834 RepID=A0ABU3EE57_9RHOB|nr:LysR family transcriptional regulator [Paracoccus sp. CPCC 101403]MDT1062522.1 LysR family transcriptional regulator [Paracoccus sp. CPCC 101403]